MTKNGTKNQDKKSGYIFDNFLKAMVKEYEEKKDSTNNTDAAQEPYHEQWY